MKDILTIHMKTCVSFLQPKEAKNDEKTDENRIDDVGINEIDQGKK